MSFLDNLNRGLCEYDFLEEDSDQERGRDRYPKHLLTKYSNSTVLV